MIFDLFSFQQSPAFPVSHPQIAPLHNLADAGEISFVVCLLLDVAVVAGLIPKVSVAVRTVDPLFECTGWRFPAFRTLVRAQVVFGPNISLVANSAEAAGVVELFYVADDVVVVIIQVDMKHLDGWLSAEYQLPKSVPDLHLVQRSKHFLHFEISGNPQATAGSSPALFISSKASRFCIAL
ncbi:MAG: hypothetical protein GY934_19695, partial [Gammaproteobacteria bacterium]|nr:hypothetical protein [Gammaproteobacteria bacterium]